MKVLVGVVIAAAITFSACSQGGGASTEMKTLADSVSYTIGTNIGNSFKQDSIQVNPELLVQAIKDALAGTTTLPDSIMQAVMMKFQMEMQKKMTDRADQKKEVGKKFLAENGKKPGITVLPSGVQYQVLQEGSGAIPDSTSKVMVNYKGTFIDGTTFDTNEGGEPVQFQVNRVIPGFTEALLNMKVGSKWRIFIPSELGYGAQGAGQKVGPNETLIFEMELVSIAS